MNPKVSRSYYKDAVSNYLIIRCPQSALEDYQYRMIAANRINGILSCSLRTIDGETCLYYDVTGRESLEMRIGSSGISGKELKIFLYSVTAVLHSLSDYLLDAGHLLMDPDYIFYDYEEEQYCFTYYPETQSESGMKQLLDYLAERLKPEEAEGAAVIYHLCDLADKPGFILREKLLDREYDAAESGNTDEMGPEQIPNHPGDFIHGQADFCDNAPDRRIDTEKYWKSGNYGSGEKKRRPMYYEDALSLEPKKEREKETIPTKQGKQKGKTSGKILALAVLFLGGAGLLEISRYILILTEMEMMAVRAGILVCLGMAMITALYGTYYTYRRNKAEKEEESIRIEEEKKNAMISSVEFDRTKEKR